MFNYSDVNSTNSSVNIFERAVDELVARYRSPLKASKESEKWVTNMISADIPSVGLVSANRFTLGKLYYFNYYPTLIEARNVYDTNPIVISVGSDEKGTGDLGLNIRFLPFNVRIQFMNALVNAAYGQISAACQGQKQLKARLQSSVNLDYYAIKPIIDRFGAGYAVRDYLKPGRTNVKVISYENWHKMACINSDTFVGESITTIHSGFSQYINNRRNNRA
jgi:hypothetical protein